MIALRVRSDAQDEGLIFLTKIMSRCSLGRDYMRARSFQMPQVSESGDMSSRPADVRDGETERFSSRPIEARYGKVSIEQNDRNIDRIQDLHAIEGDPVRCLGIAGRQR